MMADEKGIKFYLVETEDGPQLEHLQAEAKKRDPNFQTIFVDTTKQPLMERLNDLMRRAHAAESAEQEGPDVVSRPVPPPVQAPDARRQRLYDQPEFEQFIWDLPAAEAYRLDVLEQCIKERRDEFAGVKRQPAEAQAPTAKREWGSKR